MVRAYKHTHPQQVQHPPPCRPPSVVTIIFNRITIYFIFMLYFSLRVTVFRRNGIRLLRSITDITILLRYYQSEDAVKNEIRKRFAPSLITLSIFCLIILISVLSACTTIIFFNHVCFVIRTTIDDDFFPPFKYTQLTIFMLSKIIFRLNCCEK
jgi:hypothetical protein